MSDDAVLVEDLGDGVLTVTLHRPDKLNAIVGAMVDRLIEVAKACRGDGVRAVVLTGSGRAFSAGGDVKALVRMSPDETGRYLGGYARLDAAIAESGAVWVAAVNGLAYGGGLEVASMCDARVADETATFCVADIEVGALPTGGLTWRLPRMVGSGRASWLVMTNAVVDARAALAMGLIDDVVASGTCVARARQMAQSVVRFHPEAVDANRRALRQAWSSTLDQAAAVEVSESQRLLSMDEVMLPLRERFGGIA